MAITFQLPRSKHLPCLALRQHEECDMFFSPGIKKYSTYPEMASKLFRTTLTFRMAYESSKREGPRNKPYFSFRNLNQIVSLIMKNEKYLHQKNWHDCDVRTPGCRTHARLATAPSPLLLSGGSGNKRRTTHSTAQLWSLPTPISIYISKCKSQTPGYYQGHCGATI